MKVSGDLDHDGDLDILIKPYNHKTPRIDILLNGGGNLAGKVEWQIPFDGSDLSEWQKYRTTIAPNYHKDRRWIIDDRPPHRFTRK